MARELPTADSPVCSGLCDSLSMYLRAGRVGLAGGVEWGWLVRQSGVGWWGKVGLAGGAEWVG